MATTLLSTLLNRMNRYQAIYVIEEQFKVRDLDDAIRTLERNHKLPWRQKKTSLKVFADVLQYPTVADHDYLIYLEKTKQNLPYRDKLRAVYTSLKDFYEDPTNRNLIGEIWQNGSLYLGVRIQDPSGISLGSQELDPTSSTANHVASGDASNLTVDEVNYITGSSSLQFTVTDVTHSAVITDTFTPFTDPDYQKKYYFRWVYLDGLPSSISLRFGADGSNYLTGTVTQQFSGVPFTADQWNLVAFDLNGATQVGTINTNTNFAYEQITLTNAPSGVYNIDQSSTKEWQLLDYWYYSKFNVQTDGATQADQEYFFATNETYETDSSLIGPHEWADVIMYDALCTGLIDVENTLVLDQLKEKREIAWQKLEQDWPDLKPQVITQSYRFQTDYGWPGGSRWA